MRMMVEKKKSIVLIIILLTIVVIFICGRYYFAHNKSYKNEAIEKGDYIYLNGVRYSQTSKPSFFCCLPIITIGVVDYRHCNQKNLKIYLSTLHKSV